MMVEDADGKIWVWFEGAIFRLDEDQWTQLTLENGATEIALSTKLAERNNFWGPTTQPFVYKRKIFQHLWLDYRNQIIKIDIDTLTFEDLGMTSVEGTSTDAGDSNNATWHVRGGNEARMNGIAVDYDNGYAYWLEHQGVNGSDTTTRVMNLRRMNLESPHGVEKVNTGWDTTSGTLSWAKQQAFATDAIVAHALSGDDWALEGQHYGPPGVAVDYDDGYIYMYVAISHPDEAGFHAYLDEPATQAFTGMALKRWPVVGGDIETLWYTKQKTNRWDQGSAYTHYGWDDDNMDEFGGAATNAPRWQDGSATLVNEGFSVDDLYLGQFRVHNGQVFMCNAFLMAATNCPQWGGG